MLRDHLLAIDGFLPGSGTALRSSDALAERIGQTDQLAMMLIADNEGGGAVSAVTLELESSGDGNHWATYATPTMNGTAPAFMGWDTTRHHKYVRIVAYATGIGAPHVHVRVYVALRDLDIIPADDNLDEEAKGFPAS